MIVQFIFRAMSSALLIAAVLWSAVVQSESTATGSAEPNRLDAHPSPYLALHGRDPVRWFDWDDEAVKQAREQGKLIFVSSGYFSCHWCHVMQRQSYQNDDIAKLLNEHFISVKIDRELHPSLDERLMNFAQATQGRGGWPLNVYLTPDGFPLYAHMYQPPETFQDVLGKLTGVWGEQRERLEKLARDSHLVELTPPADSVDPSIAKSYAEGLVTILPDAADQLGGGFGEAQKFPMAPQLEFYLDALHLDQDDSVRDFLVTTLDAMATRGLRDHIGGGFFRYTTDPAWEVPHFEKMLYTNTMLAKLYLRAASVLDRPDYTDVARDTYDFMIREMLSSEGAMVASFSAIDDDDIEGGHYLWTAEGLAAVLDEPTRKLMRPLFSLDGEQRFPDGSLPMRHASIKEVASITGATPEQVTTAGKRAADALYKARQSRSKPTDTKLLAGWNGLALESFADAALVLNDVKYTQVAAGIRDYIVNTLWSDGELMRAVSSRGSLGATSVQDYAYVARGLLSYATVTGKPKDLELATKVTLAGFERYNRDHGWYLGQTSLIIPEQARPALEDGALPSPSAVLTETAFELASVVDDAATARQLRTLAGRALAPADRYLESNLFGFTTYVKVMLNHVAAQN